VHPSILNFKLKDAALLLAVLFMRFAVLRGSAASDAEAGANPEESAYVRADWVHDICAHRRVLPAIPQSITSHP